MCSRCLSSITSSVEDAGIIADLNGSVRKEYGSTRVVIYRQT